MMHLDSLHSLFVDELKDLYDAENQIIQALPKAASAASSPDLRKAFETHLQQTREHVNRLQEVFNHIGESPQGKTCEAMKGLMKEANEVIQSMGNASVKDAALIAAAQRVEHYEMAGYGVVRTYANELGYKEAASLLQTTLNEEGEADKSLTKLAEGGLLKTGINEKAKGLSR